MILDKPDDLARLLLEQTGNLDRLEEEFAVVERALELEPGPGMPWGKRLARLSQRLTPLTELSQATPGMTSSSCRGNHPAGYPGEDAPEAVRPGSGPPPG